MVAEVGDFGRHREVFLAEGSSPDALLEALVGRTSIRRFEVRRPSLHEVFLRAVGRTTLRPEPPEVEEVAR